MQNIETKIITGTNGLYAVRSDGVVISYRFGKEKIMTPHPERNGYMQVTLRIDGKQKQPLVARLVAQAFLPNPDDLPEVNHIDGIKAHNWKSNLEWMTHKANCIHARDNGLKPKVCKINMDDANQIRALYASGQWTYRELGMLFKVDCGHIPHIINNKIWKAA